MEIPLVEHAIVVGEGRNHVAALVTLGADALAAFAAAKGLANEFGESSVVRAEIQSGIDRINECYARAEQIRKFAILPEPLSMESRELTPTLKIKRSVVVQNHAAVIEALHAEDR